MSVTNAKEDDSIRNSVISREGRTAHRRWTVLMSDPLDGPTKARRATQIPRVGDPHPDDPFMYVEEVRCEPMGASRVLFQVDVTYATARATGGLPSNDQASPLDAPAEIRWGAAITTEAIDQDLDGNPIVNTAGEGFDPPVTEEIADPVLYITRNEPTFDPDTIRTYHGAVNSDTFYGALPGRARMVDLQASLIQDHQSLFTYWRVSYVIQFRFDTPPDPDGTTEAARKAWWKRVLNLGTRYRDTTLGPRGERNYKEILSQGGVIIKRPLDKNGLVLPEGFAPVWLAFRTKKLATFSSLNLA